MRGNLVIRLNPHYESEPHAGFTQFFVDSYDYYMKGDNASSLNSLRIDPAESKSGHITEPSWRFHCHFGTFVKILDRIHGQACFL